MKTDLTVLQNIIFPHSDICSESKLYFRADSGETYYSEMENVLYVKHKVSFDTYFNTFSVGKYKKYSRPLSLFLRLRVSGLFVLRIFGVRKENGCFVEKCIAKNHIALSQTGDFIAELDTHEEFSQLYFTLEGSGVLYSGSFEATAASTNPVNIAVVICTFKREKFLMRNHRQIRAYLDNNRIFTTDNIHFYIVDNGKTLSGQEIESPYITLIPNGNTGGSGGFSRGYYEAATSGRNYTHILFMDDDIVLDCESIMRVYGLLRVRNDQYNGISVGGTMLRLSDHITQYEAGSYWDGKHLHSIGTGTDMTVRENVFEVPYYPQGNYNAWWFYCFPSDWNRKHGYPLPFFVKEDDIEYSLRCAEEIAIIGGIAVWHDDFEGKYNGFQEYYIKRNELIMTSVNDQKPYALFQVRKLILNVMKQVVFQRYFLADIVIRAYDDYLKGWEHFKNTDTELFNIELMNACQQLLNDHQLQEYYGVCFDRKKYEHSLSEPDNNKALILSLNGYLIPKCFYQADKDEFNVVDLAKCRYVNFYKHPKVLHYDVSRHKGFVTVQKRSQLFRYFFLLLGKSIKFLIQYPSVRKGYKEHLAELSDFRPHNRDYIEENDAT